MAQTYINQLLEDKIFPKITTTLEPFTGFYPAEDYHQNFKSRNKDHSYIINVSVPRLEEFKAKHKGCE